MSSQLVNFVMYQAGWFAIVFGAANQLSTLGALVAMLLTVLHILLVRERGRAFKLCIAAAIIGLIAESYLQTTRSYVLADADQASVPPAWIIMLWIQFSTLLPFCLKWLSGRYLLASILGLVGGPLAFLAGERIGAVTFPPPRHIHLATLGFAWMCAMPLLVLACDAMYGKSRQHASYRWVRNDHVAPSPDQHPPS